MGGGSVGKRDSEALEGDDDVGRPWPGLLEPDDCLAAGAGDGGRGVPHAVTQLLGFGDSQLAVEAQRLRPGVEVLGDQHELQPGFVADEVLAGQVAQPGVFGGPDAVLDVGAVAVPQLEAGDVGVGLVGDEHLMAEPLGGVEQRQLGARVGTFSAGDHPHPLTPAVVDEVGQLDQPGAVTTRAVGVDGRHPILVLHQHEGVAHGGVDRQPDQEPDLAFDATIDEVVRRPGGVGAHQHLHLRRAHRQLGQRRVEHGEMIGGVVRARPTRTQQPGQCFTGAVQIGEDRIEPEPAFVGRRGVLLVRMGVHQGAVKVDHDLVGGGASGPRPRPRRRPRRRRCCAARATCTESSTRHTVGSDATPPNRSGC